MEFWIILIAIIWFIIYRSQKRRKRLDSALEMSKKDYVKEYGSKTDKRANFELENEWTLVRREEKELKNK